MQLSQHTARLAVLLRNLLRAYLMRRWVLVLVWAFVAGISVLVFFRGLLDWGAALWLSPSPGDLLIAGVTGVAYEVIACFYLLVAVLATVVYWIVGGVIALRKPEEMMPVVASTLLMSGGVALSPVLEQLVLNTYWQKSAFFVQTIAFASTVVFFYLFPDGKHTPGWTRVFSVGMMLWAVAGLVLPPSHPAQPRNWQVGSWALMVFVWLASCVVAQVIRARTVSNSFQRQQTKWVLVGFSFFILNSGLMLVYLAVPPINEPGLPRELYRFISFLPYYLVAPAMLPLSLAFSIFRYRLWDIDVVINRTLVYGVLTTLIFAGYVLIVGAFTAIFHAQGSVLGSLLGAGVVAAIVQPIRQRLQRAVNRLLYGQRDDPYTVLSGLGERLQSALPTSEVFSTLTHTIAQSLKLPYVAVARKTEADYSIAAEHIDERYRLPEGGYDRAFLKRGGALLVFPLTHQTETLGELRLALRAPGDELSPAEQRLLRDIALHAGLALHNHQLSEEAQRARERLVAAREDERRRIRRDLHDHFAPALAGLTLKIDAIRNRLDREPEAAQEMLAELRDRTQHTINEIRQLAYDLRPPALDDLGLVGALRDLAARLNDRHGLAVGVGFHGEGPPLTAAVEAAAYRIAAEALLNVVRHAQATHCAVRLTYQPGPALWLEVHDDGVGAQTPFRAGVGLSGMRERAEELGGAFVIAATLGGGTYLRAELPIRPAHTEAKENLTWANFES